MITDKECEEIVLYLSGAYPQLKLNGVGTALAWENMLNKINATYEECKSACEKIIRDGYKDWEINLSLMVDIISKKRREERDNKIAQQELERLKNTPQIKPERIEEAKKQLKEIYGF